MIGWSAQGVRARFPAEWSPVEIGRDTTVGDRFSGYEWRMVLEQGTSSWLVAFVIPPDPRQLTLTRFVTNEEAVRAGGSRVRRCDPDLMTIRCGRTSRGLVRLVGGQLELLVTEPSWTGVAAGGGAAVHLAVRRGGAELWSASHRLQPDPE